VVGADELQRLLANLNPEQRPGAYVFSTVDDPEALVGIETLASVVEPEGVSVVTSQGEADRAGLAYDYVAGWITLHVHSALDAVGLTAAVSQALAERDISCNVVAGFHHDHLLVPLARVQDALDAIGALAAATRPWIRGTGLADVTAIAEFQTRCWREAYQGLVPRSYLDRVGVAQREPRWRERMASGARQVALAEVADEVVGVVSWGAAGDASVPPVELKSLYVAAGHRGSGLAARLLEHALGDGPASLWVFEHNPRALAFYTRYGFHPDGHRAVDPDTGLWERRYVRP
jgi:ribosomal protein S18 acetylase RimI-like enzyme